MSEKAFDFEGTHANQCGAQYEKLGEALFVYGAEPPIEQVVVYRNADNQWFVRYATSFDDEFDDFPLPIFQKDLSNEMIDKLRTQLMTSGMALQSIRPGILTEIANLLEQRINAPGAFAVSVIEKRQVTAFVRLMRVAEKYMKAWVLADAAFRMIDPSKRS